MWRGGAAPRARDMGRESARESEKERERQRARERERKGERESEIESENGGAYRGTSLIRNCRPLRPYSRTMPRALRWSWGGGAFLMSVVPLCPPP